MNPDLGPGPGCHGLRMTIIVNSNSDLRPQDLILIGKRQVIIIILMIRDPGALGTTFKF